MAQIPCEGAAARSIPPFAHTRSNTTAPIAGRVRICPLKSCAAYPPFVRSGSDSTWNTGQEELNISLKAPPAGSPSHAEFWC